MFPSQKFYFVHIVFESLYLVDDAPLFSVIDRQPRDITEDHIGRFDFSLDQVKERLIFQYISRNLYGIIEMFVVDLEKSYDLLSTSRDPLTESILSTLLNEWSEG